MARAISSLTLVLVLSLSAAADVTPPHSGVMGRDSANNVRLELRTSAGTPYIDFARDETTDYGGRIILLPASLDIIGPAGSVRIFDQLSVSGGIRFSDGTVQTTAGVGMPATHGNMHAGGGSDPIPAATGSVSGLMSAADKAMLDAATPDSVAGTLVRRNSSGDFSAGLIQASQVTLQNGGSIWLGSEPVLQLGESPTTFFAGPGAGSGALTSGAFNTGLGSEALDALVTGAANTAAGYGALSGVTEGNSNTAIGASALGLATTAANNVAVGAYALENLDSGDNNIAVGVLAGIDLFEGSSNILIGSRGADLESNTIRIGGADHSAAYIMGVFGSTSPDGAAVFVDVNGRLGTITSSRRYKTDVVELGDTSEIIEQLRPVSFRYREESGTPQFGLIAEEVAQIDPNLVVFDEKGNPETVRYHFLTPILIRTIQHQQSEIDDLRERLARLERRLAATP